MSVRQPRNDNSPDDVVRPRRISFVGVQQVVALFFDARHVLENDARQRILDLWQPGSSVRRGPGGLLVLFGSPRSMDARLTPGTPLIREGCFHSAPLSPSERQSFRPPGDWLFVDGGRLEVRELSAWQAVAPETWLDLETYVVIEMVTLAAPPPPPEPAIKLAEGSLRDRLHGVPDMDAKAARALVAMRQKLEASTSGRASGSTSGDSEGLTLGQALVGVGSAVGAVASVAAMSIASVTQRFLRRSKQVLGSGSSPRTNTANASGRPRKDRWGWLVSQMVMASQMWRVLGPR